LNKKIFFLFFAILGLIIISLFLVDGQEKTKNTANFESYSKPNIVFIMTDDLSENMLDIALSNNLLPNLNKHIFEKGTKFTNSFVTYPICCPTRATALVGQYSHNHGVEGIRPPLGGVGKFNDTNTLATLLQQNGYQTGFVGKYLNGYGALNGTVPSEYVPPGWDQWHATIQYPNKDYGGMYKYLITVNGNVSEVDGKYKTYTEGEHLVDIINGNFNNENPFFLSYWPRVPHFTSDGFSCELPRFENQMKTVRSIKVPPEYDSMLDGISIPHSKSFNEDILSDKVEFIIEFPKLNQQDIDCVDELMRDHVESLIPIDDIFGDLINVLNDNKQLENTIFIFTSDNGYQIGEHMIFGKNMPFEESIRVPLYFSGLGIPKQTIDKIVTSNDWAVTISNYAGIGIFEDVDGMSLKPLIDNPSIKWRKQFLIEGAKEKPGFFFQVRTETDSYTKFIELGIIMYYDLVNDSYQLQDTSNDPDPRYIDKIDKLDAIMMQLRSCSEQECRDLEMKEIKK